MGGTLNGVCPQPVTALMISAVDSERGRGGPTGWVALGTVQGGLDSRQPESVAPGCATGAVRAARPRHITVEEASFVHLVARTLWDESTLDAPMRDFSKTLPIIPKAS